MSKQKGYCWGPDCKEEIEVQTCCGDRDGSCGCRGLPVDPPFCSAECYNAYMSERQGHFDSKPEIIDLDTLDDGL